ncbi:nucleoside hydrolase-like domain-containing protein [Corallococcus terminator]|uniref:nucleoside hydrolase-like domain-containing protein n=1 Tax=Corallococcus terminator TaxID=2316733 RepID=UPI001315A600|nr:nucleoside hydrolase-like domain-containing protein [Corallococcus terminator]
MSTLLASTASAQTAPAKPRLLVTTDIGGDPDDQQSMRRLLLYANEFDLTGLLASAAGTAGELETATVRPDLIEDIVDDYEAVLPNLSRHATGFPTAATLRSRIKAGTKDRGVANLGTGRSTAASNHIITTVDASTAPLYVAIWGGAHELAQALYDVRAARTPAQLATFLSRLRVYAIADQDKGTSPQGTGEWIRANFPTLRYVEAGPPSTNGYTSLFRGMYQNDSSGGGRPTVQLVESPVVPLNQEAWLNTHVRTGHGVLGAGYPVVIQNPGTSRNTKGVKEGDTPSWFYVLPNGLQDPEQPTWGGWGGRFKLDAGQHFIDAEDAHWTGNSDYGVRRKWTVARWREAQQNDFAARLDWCVAATFAGANHAPVAGIDGGAGTQVVQRTVASGSVVNLSATGSTDPDGDTLSYQWFQYLEAGTHAQAVALTGATTRDVRFTAPTVSTASTVHLILAVRDNGSPALTRYRRVVVTVQPSSGGDPSLRGEWKLDEGQGGTTADGSSFQQSGTLLNGPVWVAGHQGSAVEFDGVDDRIDLGNPTHLRLTGAMTLSAWVFIDDFAGNGRIVNKQGGSGSRGWSLNVEAGGFASFQVASSATQLVLVNGASSLPTGQWIHLAGTYEPGVALRLWVNGVQDAALTTGVPASQYNPSLNVALGNRPGGGTPFNGRIDAVRVYDRVLGAAELQQL